MTASYDRIKEIVDRVLAEEADDHEPTPEEIAKAARR